MAQYFLSQNPTINNFGLDNNTIDRFFVDTGSASTLNIFQSGNNVIVTNGVNTATFTNQLLSQFATYANSGNNNVVGVSTVSVTDGTSILVGTDAADVRNGTTIAGGDFFLTLGAGDTLTSNGGGDLIFGNQGNDGITLNADIAGNSSNLGRAATVFGGQGNDAIVADASQRSAILFGNLGDDSISLQNALDYNPMTVFGGQGNDVINATNAGASHTLYGDLGNDFILGGSGNDTIFGGADADTLNGGAGNDLLFGNQGTDVITGSAGNDTVFGGQDADVISYAGQAGVQILLGNMGSDTITGGNANDTIFGGQGNDYVIGGTGADRISGDLGSDVIGYTGAFTAAGIGAESGLTTATADQIAGFVTGVDRLSFSNGAPAAAPGNYTEFANSQVTTVEQAVTAATTSNNSLGGNRNYVFVAGASNGYLVEFNAGVAIAAQTLNGLNSTASFEYTDIINTAPTAIA